MKSTSAVARRASRSAILGAMLAATSCHHGRAAPDANAEVVPQTVYGGPPAPDTTPVPTAPMPIAIPDGGHD